MAIQKPRDIAALVKAISTPDSYQHDSLFEHHMRENLEPNDIHIVSVYLQRVPRSTEDLNMNVQQQNNGAISDYLSQRRMWHRPITWLWLEWKAVNSVIFVDKPRWNRLDMKNNEGIATPCEAELILDNVEQGLICWISSRQEHAAFKFYDERTTSCHKLFIKPIYCITVPVTREVRVACGTFIRWSHFLIALAVLSSVGVERPKMASIEGEARTEQKFRGLRNRRKSTPELEDPFDDPALVTNVLNMRNEEGLTALEMAVRAGSDTCAMLITKYARTAQKTRPRLRGMSVTRRASGEANENDIMIELDDAPPLAAPFASRRPFVLDAHSRRLSRDKISNSLKRLPPTPPVRTDSNNSPQGKTENRPISNDSVSSLPSPSNSPSADVHKSFSVGEKLRSIFAGRWHTDAELAPSKRPLEYKKSSGEENHVQSRPATSPIAADQKMSVDEGKTLLGSSSQRLDSLQYILKTTLVKKIKGIEDIILATIITENTAKILLEAASIEPNNFADVFRSPWPSSKPTRLPPLRNLRRRAASEGRRRSGQEPLT
ncbi:unnamed protein product [Cylicocyclus nassatus]|uniref:Uncharacterized protein n=1 Tax=Cylicocyclus nassatus TaxID=53992 RepID=A0AA36MEE3_CYLNA|nr:unnamed protein product [Cylicocyclus nassatus]